jgi:hypothetical protein
LKKPGIKAPGKRSLKYFLADKLVGKSEVNRWLLRYTVKSI